MGDGRKDISADQMRQVLEVARSLAVTADLDTLLRRIAISATALLNAERASIYLHDHKASQLWTRIALGAGEIRVSDSAGIVGHSFRSNSLLNVPEPYDDPRFNRDVDRNTGFVTRNLLTCPARAMDGKPIGVLQVINRIGGEFTSTDEEMISMLADQAGVAIQRHYLHLAAVQATRLRYETEVARGIQAAMIPQSPPQIAGLQSAGWSQPASETAGDAYDLWQTPDGRLAAFVADASGHGIGPAIMVDQARSLVRAFSDINCDPMWVLQRVNARMAQDLTAGMFVTVFLACISPDGLVQWCSAGHGGVFLRKRAGAALEAAPAQAPPIGLVPDLPCDPIGATRLEPGGMLVALTDGFFECRNPRGKMFEFARLRRWLSAAANLPPDELLNRMRRIVRKWQQKDEPEDDQTAIVVRTHPRP